jgi:hypothetical protein
MFREKMRLNVFNNRMLRRILGRRRDEKKKGKGRNYIIRS